MLYMRPFFNTYGSMCGLRCSLFGQSTAKLHLRHASWHCRPETRSIYSVSILAGTSPSMPFSPVGAYQVLGDFSERTPLLLIVDDQTHAASLGAFDGLLDAVQEVGPAGADVRLHTKRVRQTLHHSIAMGFPVPIQYHLYSPRRCRNLSMHRELAQPALSRLKESASLTFPQGLTAYSQPQLTHSCWDPISRTVDQKCSMFLQGIQIRGA